MTANMPAEAFVAALDADDAVVRAVVGEYVDAIKPLQDLYGRIWDGALDNRPQYLSDANAGVLKLLARHLYDAICELERPIRHANSASE
jgi:hypothetical protein